MPLRIAKQDALRFWQATPSYACPFCQISTAVPFDYDAAAEMWCGKIGPRQPDGSLPWCTRRSKTHSTHIFCDIKSNQHVEETWPDDRERWRILDGKPAREAEAETPAIVSESVATLERQPLNHLELAARFNALALIARESCEFCGPIEGQSLASVLMDRHGCLRPGCSRSIGHDGDHIGCDPLRRKHGISIWWEGDASFRREPEGDASFLLNRVHSRYLAWASEHFGEVRCCEIVGAKLSDFAPRRIPPSSGRGIAPWRRSYLEKNLILEANALRATRGGWESGWGIADCST